jgi:hypothetical protein
MATTFFHAHTGGAEACVRPPSTDWACPYGTKEEAAKAARRLVHMVRRDPVAFCGATDVTFACPDPGCEDHAGAITCPACLARPAIWDYMIRHALALKAANVA